MITGLSDLYTALSPRSWILSSLQVSLALQKCQTRWQCVVMYDDEFDIMENKILNMEKFKPRHVLL